MNEKITTLEQLEKIIKEDVNNFTYEFEINYKNKNIKYSYNKFIGELSLKIHGIKTKSNSNELCINENILLKIEIDENENLSLYEIIENKIININKIKSTYENFVLTLTSKSINFNYITHIINNKYKLLISEDMKHICIQNTTDGEYYIEFNSYNLTINDETSVFIEKDNNNLYIYVCHLIEKNKI